MTDETLNITLSNLRDDLDMLLNAHYSTSEDGIAGMKERISSAIANISTLTDALNEANNTLTQHETSINSCKNKDDIFDGYYVPIITKNNTDINNLWSDFRDFLDNFLKLSEKQETAELYEKINVWSPYLSKLRKILDILDAQDAQDLKDMLENGNTGGGTVSEELTNQVNENTTNISNLQGRVTTLEGQVAKYLTPPDPNYSGKSFTDYPAGTIIQTYDYDERNYNLSNTQTITTPTLYFCTEQSATAKITITSNVSLQTAGTVKVRTFLNGTQIDERNFELQTDCTLQQISFDLYDANLNTDTKANNIYTTFLYNYSSSNTITLKYQKVEIIASNIMFLNKLCPFDAFYFDGKYHLTDCSGGTIKIAEIEAENMHNMDNLTWTDTLIPAQECISAGSYNAFSGNSFETGELYKLKRTLENNYYIGKIENSYQAKLFSQVKEMDYITQFLKTINFASTTIIGGNSTYLMYYDPTNNSISRTTCDINGNGFVKFSGHRYYESILEENLLQVNIKHINNGKCYLRTKMKEKSSNTIELTDGNISSVVVTNFTNENKYDIHAYVHHFDKMIRYSISFDNTATEKLVINSIEEFGTHDKIFEMPNDCYFAVKNNQLIFGKLQK